MAIRRPSRFALIVGVVCTLLLFHVLTASRVVPPVSFSSHPKLPIAFRPSSFNWSTIEDHFPAPEPIAQLPNEFRPLPRIQHEFSISSSSDSEVDTSQMESRRAAVKMAFLQSWDNYKSRAWGFDELAPVSGKAKNTFGGWAATMVDALDTLYIMGLEDEFREAAAEAVKIDFAKTKERGVNLFETTIRHLGGLLSAYDLSREPALLEKAEELGEMLYHAFDTPNRMPGFWLTFEDAKTGKQIAGTHDPSAGPTSLSMEFSRLAQLTGKSKYFDAINRVKTFLLNTQEKSSLPGMWPTSLNFQGLTVQDNSYTLGALADSLYEYLLKTYVLLGAADESWTTMYARAMETVEKYLLFRPMLPDQDDILFAGTASIRKGNVELNPEGQHLACFTGGMFALGGKILENEHHIDLGRRLTKGCTWAYKSMATGIMPEIFTMLPCRTGGLGACEWNEERWREHGDHNLAKGYRNAREPKYILRPEAIESVFILYRLTGDEELRETAWEMFQSIITATRTNWGNSAIKDVSVKGETVKTDSMESFWLSETLKYFYLIFSSPDVISLDEYVFNTEAHPFRRPGRDVSAEGLDGV